LLYVANKATGQIFGYRIGTQASLTSIGGFNTENPANPNSGPPFLAITQ
jgi:hypothetical protein